MNSRFKLLVVSFSTILVVLLLVGAVMGKNANPDDAYRHLAVFTEVLSRIKSEYVEEPDIKHVTLGATNGLLEALDPFASYLNAEQYKQVSVSSDEKSAGVGVTLSRRFGYVGVVNVVPNSPAWRNGLSTGDMLESINGIATRDMPLAFAQYLLRGEPGSTVKLEVLRVRKPEPQEITLTRAKVTFPPVSGRMVAPTVGLVHAPHLGGEAVKDITRHAKALQKQGAEKLILDLRNSGFAQPADGAAVADMFLDQGLITYIEGQKYRKEEIRANADGTEFGKIPLAVLTNRGTANAAEVAAGALLHNKRAEVVGERTYGDAAVRRPITLEDGSAIILSVAKYYSPDGKALQDHGVTPSTAIADVEPPPEVEEGAAALEDEPVGPPPVKKDEEDATLQKAIEVLTGKPMSAEVEKPEIKAPATGTAVASGRLIQRSSRSNSGLAY
jgi:carboxyl-terminal processing protease